MGNSIDILQSVDFPKIVKIGGEVFETSGGIPF